MYKSVKKLWLPSLAAMYVSEATIGPDPAWVQAKNHFNGSSSDATCVATFDAPVASGNTVLVVFGTASTGDDYTVADDKGNTYIAGPEVAGGSYTWASFYSIGVTNAPTVITVSINSGVSARSYNSILISEYSHVGAFDVSAGNPNQSGSGTTDAITSTAATTNFNGELIFGACVNLSGVSTLDMGTGFTQDQVSGENFNTEYLIQPTAGSVAATFTGTGSDNFSTLMMAFKRA